jgi:hypothetical protein
MSTISEKLEIPVVVSPYVADVVVIGLIFLSELLCLRPKQKLSPRMTRALFRCGWRKPAAEERKDGRYSLR